MCRRPHFPSLDCGLEILWHNRWLHLLRWRNRALSHKRVVCRLDSLLQALETRWDNGPRRFQGCILGLCRLFLPTALGTLQKVLFHVNLQNGDSSINFTAGASLPQDPAPFSTCLYDQPLQCVYLYLSEYVMAANSPTGRVADFPYLDRSCFQKLLTNRPDIRN